MRVKLTRRQREVLFSLPDEFTAQEASWKASPSFFYLLDNGLADWKDAPLPHTAGDVRCGPGSHGSYRWWIKRTPAGRTALSQHEDGGEGV